MVKRAAQTWVAQPTSTPTPTTCVDCGADILEGWFDTLKCRYDPQPLSQLGEALALLGGARTFLLIDTHIHRRRAHTIKAFPYPRFGELLREHRCGAVLMDAEKRAHVKHVTKVDEQPDF